MKNIFKRITLAICAALTAAMLVGAPVLASSGMTHSGSGAGVTATVDATNTTSVAEQSSGQQAVNVGASSVTTQASTSSSSNKKYATGWTVFIWFIISVIVNFILSCWIGNRFYSMARKSAQSSNEIRALRKDIEERFGSMIKEVDEPATEVLNSNESYARDGEGLAMPEHKSHVELNDEEREMMRRWDSKRTSARAFDAPDEEEEDAEDFEESRRPARRAYKPTRRSSGIEFEDDEDAADDDEPLRERTAPRRGGKPVEALTNAKNKAKDFLSNVFPFEE